MKAEERKLEVIGFDALNAANRVLAGEDLKTAIQASSRIRPGDRVKVIRSLRAPRLPKMPVTLAELARMRMNRFVQVKASTEGTFKGYVDASEEDTIQFFTFVQLDTGELILANSRYLTLLPRGGAGSVSPSETAV